MSQKAKAGDTVRIHYTGKFETGKVFDSSKDKDPMEFEIGNGQVIPGFDNAIIGMTVGEKKDAVTILPKDAYGDYEEKLIFQVSRDTVPADVGLELGMHLQMANEENQTINVIVSEITDEVIKLDSNHPLAGKTIIFDIELVDII